MDVNTQVRSYIAIEKSIQPEIESHNVESASYNLENLDSLQCFPSMKNL